MENQTKPKPLGLSMAKLVLVVAVIVSLGAVLGVAGYYLTKQKPIISPTPKTISAIEISADKKSILNAETKEAVFAIEDANKYLKDSGYAYNSDTFQETKAKYAGDCFLSASLSNKKDRIVFSSGCLSGDLPQAWVGIYNVNWGSDPNTNCVNTNCLGIPKFKFLINGSGRNFVWSADDKTVTYEADLGLLGMTETRTINSVTGEIINKINNENETANWQIYRNEEYGFEINYPKEWTLNEQKDEKIAEKISLNSPENEKLHKKIESGEVYGEGYMRDITIIYYGSIPGGTFDEFVKRELISSLNPVNFAGQSAYEAIMGHFGAYHSILIEKNNHLYIIQFGNQEDKSKLTKTDNQILSTLKFIEKDETANWQTYKNKDYGFEIKYPSVEGVRVEENIAKAGRFKDKVFSTEITTLELNQPFSTITKDDFRIVLGVGDYSFRPCLYTDEYTELISEVEKISLQSIEFEKAKIRGEGWEGYEIQFCGVKNDITYGLTIFDYDSFYNQPALLIDQILSTFRFLK